MKASSFLRLFHLARQALQLILNTNDELIETIDIRLLGDYQATQKKKPPKKPCEMKTISFYQELYDLLHLALLPLQVMNLSKLQISGVNLRNVSNANVEIAAQALTVKRAFWLLSCGDSLTSELMFRRPSSPHGDQTVVSTFS